MKRKILIIILALWTVFIFYNSFKAATDSIKESSAIVIVVENIVEYVYNDEVPESLVFYIDNTFESDLRNFAHFFEFFILYILIYLNIRYFNMCGFKLLLKGLYISLIIATIDESIQVFSIGRAFEMTDLFTDLFGALVAFAIIYIISKYIKKDYGVCSV